MNLKNLVIAILFAIGALIYYRLHCWWLKDREKNDAFFKPNTKVYVFRSWFFFIVLIIMSIIYFVKFIK